MTEGFHPIPGVGAAATFSGFEADLLRSLAQQIVELLRNEQADRAARIAKLPARVIRIALRGHAGKPRHIRV